MTAIEFYAKVNGCAQRHAVFAGRAHRHTIKLIVSNRRYWPRKNKLPADQRARNLEWRKAAIIHLGSECQTCGFADHRALQIDHVNGGGSQEHKKNMGYITYLKKVIADANGLYQLLCANCNWIKRYEKGE